MKFDIQENELQNTKTKLQSTTEELNSLKQFLQSKFPGEI